MKNLFKNVRIIIPNENIAKQMDQLLETELKDNEKHFYNENKQKQKIIDFILNLSEIYKRNLTEELNNVYVREDVLEGKFVFHENTYLDDLIRSFEFGKEDIPEDITKMVIEFIQK